MKAKEFFAAIRESLFSQNITCDLCGTEVFDGSNLCRKCAAEVELNNKTVCPVCGRKTARAEICLECKAEAPLFKRATSAIIYSDGGARLILKFKRGAKYLKNYLGNLMAEKAKKLPACDCVTYVPITKKRRRERGYNQGELLAEVVAQRLELPLVHALIKKRDTDDQKSLSKRERTDNLKGCFEVTERQKIKGKRVLLVDDVLTTGATAEEVSRKLLSCGASEVYLVTAASVEYKPFRPDERILP